MGRRILLLAALGFALAAGGAQGSPTVVRDCHLWADYPNTLISSARNLTCKAAVTEMKRYHGQIFRQFRTPGSFVCTRVSGVPEGGQWRCVRGAQAFRFEFRD